MDSKVETLARTVWAKSEYDAVRRPARWLPLIRHLDDTAAVAGRLWDEWLPRSVRALVTDSIGGDDRRARDLTVFLAGIHDIGKASPAFAVQVPQLADRMRVAGLPMPTVIPNDERRKARHELVGLIALEAWLCDRHQWSATASQQLGVIIGGHHGVPPEYDQARRAALRSDLVGAEPWVGVQRYLLDRAARRNGVGDFLESLREVELSQPVQVVLTAVVIIADWIASNGDLFPLSRLDDVEPDFDDDARVTQAWDLLHLPRPWEPVIPTASAGDVLSHRFGLPAGATIRPVQQFAFDLASTMDVPGIMVIEAPMGEGKTEAALLAAEVLAARTGAGGCFVALPTQASTDAMFSRVLSWLSRVPDARLAMDATRAIATERSVMLSHGKASLNATFGDLWMAGEPSRIAEGAVDVVVHSWLTGRKKGPLADFVVGTIDQLLFSSLRSRHLALRHLGLARKIVIVDEVHSYDAYMDVYLSRSLEWLGAYGVPVVLLSATLPSDIRAALVEAYRSGAASGQRRPTTVLKQAPSWAKHNKEREGRVGQVTPGPYPAITLQKNNEVSTVQVPASGRPKSVRIDIAADDLSALDALLDEALADGGCALVVRNTVRRAQEAARHLSEHYGADVEIAHSRYIGHDRVAKDAWLGRCFGPPDLNGHSAARPKRKIVVATQVVEQSLDVDFDLLVTDLAPIDLVLQRVGRMHRHERGPGQSNRPERLRDARCVIVGVNDWTASPPEVNAGSAKIYGSHMLFRAAALISEIIGGGGRITLPADIARLVQLGYSDVELGPPAWQPSMAEAASAAARAIADKRARANTFRLASPRPPGEPVLGWLRGNIGEADDTPEGQAQVRDAEDSLEVLVLQRSPGGQLRIPDWVTGHAGRAVPMNVKPSAALARIIAGCALRLPTYLTRGQSGDLLIAALEKNWHPELQESPLIAGQLIMELDDDRRGTYGPWTFHYDARFGLEVSERD